jgi:hypothetical protein
MNTTGYSIQITGNYITIKIMPSIIAEDLRKSSEDLLALIQENPIKKLLVDFEMTYSEKGDMFRIEALNFVSPLKNFDKIAVYCSDPQQLEYFKKLSGMLLNMQIIKDLDDVQIFNDLNQAGAWLTAA